MKCGFLIAAILAWATISAPMARAQREIVVLPYAGPISPASAEYIARGIAEAGPQKAAAVILELDTPGGLDSSMR